MVHCAEPLSSMSSMHCACHPFGPGVGRDRIPVSRLWRSTNTRLQADFRRATQASQRCRSPLLDRLFPAVAADEMVPTIIVLCGCLDPDMIACRIFGTTAGLVPTHNSPHHLTPEPITTTPQRSGKGKHHDEDEFRKNVSLPPEPGGCGRQDTRPARGSADSEVDAPVSALGGVRPPRDDDRVGRSSASAAGC